MQRIHPDQIDPQRRVTAVHGEHALPHDGAGELGARLCSWSGVGNARFGEQAAIEGDGHFELRRPWPPARPADRHPVPPSSPMTTRLKSATTSGVT